jgi:hypothetical protein
MGRIDPDISTTDGASGGEPTLTVNPALDDGEVQRQVQGRHDADRHADRDAGGRGVRPEYGSTPKIESSHPTRYMNPMPRVARITTAANLPVTRMTRAE